MDTIRIILQGIENFPTLPTIYYKLTEVMEKPNSTANDAAEVITKDQSASAKILQAAHSSIYGFYGKIDSISKAIFYLGFEEVRNLIVLLTLIEILPNNKSNYFINPVEFWKHSIGVGIITRNLGSIIGVNKLENYFVSGVIHDLGKILFINYLNNEYIKVIRYVNENNVGLTEAETTILGINHNVAGEMLAEKWKLPISMKSVIRHHNSGLIAGEVDTLVGCVHIANIAAQMFGFGNTTIGKVPEPNMEVWNKLNFPKNTFSSIMDKVYREYYESLALFKV
ncbi:MAG: HDOD domain-containing protein [Candidatus Kapabacteria bacterium]|nr:HDOD domain-containing protein [Candidatus Kapabacteria bacterium]